MGNIAYSVIWGGDSGKDMAHYVRSGNVSFIKKIKELISELTLDPYQGKGLPKQLSGNLKGFYSRRIVGKHRLVYEINETEKKVIIVRIRGHYEDK